MRLHELKLKQARKQTGLTVRQMARLIGTNHGNLSKQERGKRAVTKEVLYGYRAVTGVPLTKLIAYKFNQMIDPISERAVTMIQEVEELIEPRTKNKSKKIIEGLNNVLANLSCLKEVTDLNYEKEPTKCDHCNKPEL